MTPASNAFPFLRKVHAVESDCKSLERVMTGSLGQIFTAALLLTGSAEAAERATCRGLQIWSAKEKSPDSLLRAVADSAIAGTEPPLRTKKRDPALAALPPELQRLMGLPASIRQPFVLRVLLGWPKDLCGDILRTDSRQVDENSFAAGQALAGMVARERAA